MTGPTAQQLTLASCQTLVNEWGSASDRPHHAVCLPRAQHLLRLVNAPVLDAPAIREFVDALVAELDQNCSLAAFAEEVCDSVCLLDLYPPSADRANRRRILGAFGRFNVSYYRGLAAGSVSDVWTNGLRRAQELLDLILVDPPHWSELGRLHQTLRHESLGKVGSFFPMLPALAAKARDTLRPSDGARLRELIREFDLEDPPGAFYALRPTHSEPDEWVGLPVAGFFVHRLTGTVRHFGYHELFHASLDVWLKAPWTVGAGSLQIAVGQLLARPPRPQIR